MKMALPQLVAKNDNGCGLCVCIRIVKHATKDRLHTKHSKILRGDAHSFERLAAVLMHQEIESPCKTCHPIKGYRILLPIWPLNRRKLWRAGLPVDSRRREENE